MNEKQKFNSVDLNVLRMDIMKPFDVYLKLIRDGKDQYVLYSRKGTNFTDRIRRNLLLNKVDTIYVPEDNQDMFQQYVEDNLQNIIKDKNVTSSQKSKVVYDSSRYLMRKLFEQPQTELFVRTKKTVDNIVRLILSDEKTTSNLIKISEYDYYTYTHSVNVGIFSIAFAKELLKDVPEHDFYELGLGFFLHDIGKSRIPIEILNKKGPLDENEWQIMKKHPEAGYKILEKSGYIKKESAIIVLQHHERPDGSGYPYGIGRDKIHIFGKICSMADTFDAMTTRRCYQNAYSAFEACNVIKETMLRKEIDRDLFKKFINMFTKEGIVQAG